MSQFPCFAVVGIEYPEANDTARVPELVIGLPETDKPVGTVIPTEVTVPVLATPVHPEGVVTVILVPSTVAIVAELPAAAREADLFST